MSVTNRLHANSSGSVDVPAQTQPTVSARAQVQCVSLLGGFAVTVPGAYQKRTWPVALWLLLVECRVVAAALTAQRC